MVVVFLFREYMVWDLNSQGMMQPTKNVLIKKPGTYVFFHPGTMKVE